MDFPSFNESLPLLDRFIHEMTSEYRLGTLSTWEKLENRCRSFYTPDTMDVIETKAPGWKKMAAYSDGITLTHVTCVFLSMFMLPEFQALSTEQQQLAKWIVLFHDIDKFHIRELKDTMHAFRSGIVAANTLPRIGFPVTGRYDTLIRPWGELTTNAFTMESGDSAPKPDNQKLPEILTGIEQLFGENTPACLIVKTVLLHISLNVDKNYPTPSPLKETEIREFVSPSILPLLKVMMLSDNEGWSLFEPDVRAQQNRDALDAFERVHEIISQQMIRR